MGLRDIGATLPPGFRFYPSDEELVCHYLYKKITNEEVLKGTLVEIDLHTCEPWQLPEVAKLNANEWYFFSFRDRKYATGFRTNRATTSGYWKATGKDRMVLDPTTREIVGMRKTLVFYRNRAPNGIKTGWIMHEFRLETPHMPPKVLIKQNNGITTSQEDWVLCRVLHKSKAEDSVIKLSPEFTFETTTTVVAPLNLATSPNCADQNLSRGPSQQILSIPTHHQSSFLNLFQISHQERNVANSIPGVSPKGDVGDFEFLWDDMNLGDGDGIVSNLEDMRFEIDNSMVFL